MGTDRRRVLLLTGDRVAPAMAGPAIRTVELAAVLAADHDVVVASAHPSEHPPALPHEVRLVHAPGGEHLEPLVAEADVVVAMAALLHRHRWLADAGVPLVADAYDPVLFEVLAWLGDDDTADDRAAGALAEMLVPLASADLVLCASDRQRALLVGMLAALGRVGPHQHRLDPSLRALVDVVPFGLPATPPARVAPGLRGPSGPFGADDRIVLWAGGLHEWLDPEVLVEAVARIDDPRIKAYVTAGPHPTPDVPAMAVAHRVRSLAGDRGVAGSRVVFADRWIPYHERAGVLLDADVGVSLHRETLETTFSFRTRVLDYLWASLPVVTTAGDHMAELVAAEGLGAVVPPGDADALAEALVSLCAPERAAPHRGAVARVAPRYAWPLVAAPLVAFCRTPRLAPDRRGGGVVAQPPALAELWPSPAPGGAARVLHRAVSRLEQVVARGRSRGRAG